MEGFSLAVIEAVNHPTIEEIVMELLDRLRQAATIADVNLAAGIAWQQMEERST